MKNQALLLPVFALSFTISIGQSSLATDDTYKNQAHFSVLSPFTDEKTIQLGFERRLERNGSLELDLGFRFHNEAATEVPFKMETVVGSSIRTCDNGVFFLFLLPIPVIDRCKSWNDTDTTIHSTRMHSDIFVSAQARQYFARFSRKALVPNGLYFSAGLRLGHHRFTHYTYKEGQRADIVVLDSDFTNEPNPWGLILLTGFVGSSKIIDETVYSWSELKREQADKTYLIPQFQIGAVIPVAKRFSIDLGGQIRLFGSKARKTELAPVVKVGAWF